MVPLSQCAHGDTFCYFKAPGLCHSSTPTFLWSSARFCIQPMQWAAHHSCSFSSVDGWEGRERIPTFLPVKDRWVCVPLPWSRLVVDDSLESVPFMTLCPFCPVLAQSYDQKRVWCLLRPKLYCKRSFCHLTLVHANPGRELGGGEKCNCYPLYKGSVQAFLPQSLPMYPLLPFCEPQSQYHLDEGLAT